MNPVLDARTPVPLAGEFVERAEIGLGRRHQGIGIGALGGEGAALLRQPHRHFGLRIGALGHRMHLVEFELGLVRHQRMNRVEDRVDRTVAGRLRGDVLALDVEGERGRLRAHGAGDHGQGNDLDAVVGGGDLLVHQRPITSLYNHTPDQKVSFVIKDVDDYSNGAAYFYDNKIEIWAPSLDFDFRGTHNWLRNVVTHEFTHIVQMQTAFKFSRKIPAIYLQMMTYENEQRPDVLYGFPNSIASYPISGFVVPSWFAEGVAQYNRPELNYDNWDSHRDMILRMYALDDKILSWNEISTFGKTSLGNESSYNIGFAFVNYLSLKYGTDVVEKISRALSLPNVVSMDKAIELSVGRNGKDVYEDWQKYLKQNYSEKTKYIKENLNEGKILFDKGFGNFYPIVSPDGNKLFFISTEERDYLGQTKIIIYDLQNNSFESLDMKVSSQISFSKDGKKIYYSRTSEDNPQGSKVFDIYEFTIQTKDEKRLTFNSRAGQPIVYENQIAFLISRDGTINLGIKNLSDDSIRIITKFKNGEQLFTPKFSNDGKKIVCGFSDKANQDIILINIETGKIETIIEDNSDNRSPIFSEDGKTLYFASDKSGIFNIYNFDFETREQNQITNSVGGAFMPTIKMIQFIIPVILQVDIKYLQSKTKE